MSTLQPLDVSIIIPVFNKVELTEVCLASLDLHTTRRLNWEVIVVDNASSDGTAAYLQRAQDAYPWLRVIRNEINLGFSGASNQGASASRAPALLFLNNDTEAHAGWLEPLVRTLYSEPKVVATGAKLIFGDGTLQHAGVILLDQSIFNEPMLPSHIYPNQPADTPSANQRRVYQVLTGACLLVKRPAFEAVGQFDEEFWNGYEDVDLCLKLNAEGWRCVYEPESVLTHYESQSGPERFRKVAQNIERLNTRWKDRLTADYKFTSSGKCEKLPTAKTYPYLGAEGLTFDDILVSLRRDPPSFSDRRAMEERPALARQRLSPIVPPARYNVVVVEPPGYQHAAAFDEVADLLVYSLRSLGFPAQSQRNVADPHAMNIVLGYHLMPNPADLKNVPHVVYQLEQLSEREGWFKPETLETLRFADEVWDYSAENIALLAKHGVTNVRLLPIGQHDALRRIGRQTQDVDVLFYGVLNARRRAVLEEIGKFADVKCLVGVYGSERDQYVARSKIVLNLHYYEAEIMEQVRVSYLLNNHVFVISEASPHNPYGDALVTARQGDLVETVRHYLANPQERYRKAKEGYQWMKSRPMSELLAPLLHQGRAERRATG